MNVAALALTPMRMPVAPGVTINDIHGQRLAWRQGIRVPYAFGDRYAPYAASLEGLGVSKSGVTSSILTTAGSSLLSYSPASGPVAPFVAAAGAILVLGGQIARMFGGCGDTCTVATDLANQWSDAVNKIKEIYWATPTPRYKSFQQTTLDQLQQAADWLRQGCSDPSLGNAGKRCISERLERGGTAPWCPTADHRGCDFYTVIFDPIANDPNVIPDPSDFEELTGGFFNDITGGGSNKSTVVLLLAGVALLALLATI